MSGLFLRLLFVTGCVMSVAFSFPENRQLVQRNGNPRSSRGFQVQNGKLSTARGFGKRGNNNGGSESSNNNGPFVGSPSLPQSSSALDNNLVNFPSNFDTKLSYPSAWLVDEIQNNPETARFIIEKFVDENGDGEITTEELSRRSGFL